MSYLLDTNACIRYLNGRSDPLRRQLEAHQPEEIVLCSVVKAELFFGAWRSQNPQHILEKQKQFTERFLSLSFDDRAAEIYGHIRADLAQKGTPIGPNDLLIAAIALAAEVTLVTHNLDEFSRIVGLSLEDWEVE